MKKELAPYPAVFPVPSVLVTVYDEEKSRSNIITIAWAGNVCSEPPTVGISVRPARYSNRLLKKEMEFIINIPTVDLLESVDKCGTLSGRDVDKFEVAGLTPEPGKHVRAHHIKECPVSIEAKVRHIINLGVHDLFLAEIVGVFVEEEYLDEHGRRPDYGRIRALGYCPEKYVITGDVLERYGFTIKK
jgi:flavin reductase (DIM6/NTAB) family NADH-FMN oxidoreductase RutF